MKSRIGVIEIKFNVDKSLDEILKNIDEKFEINHQELKDVEGKIYNNIEILTPDVILKIAAAAFFVGFSEKAGQETFLLIKKAIKEAINFLHSNHAYVFKKSSRPKINLFELKTHFKNRLTIRFMFSSLDEEKDIDEMVESAKELINLSQFQDLDNNLENLPGEIKIQLHNIELIWNKEDRKWQRFELADFIKDGKLIYPK